MLVRAESRTDQQTIRDVLRAAFRGDVEVRIVDALRHRGHLECSLVADVDGRVVGHVARSPVRLEPESAVRMSGIGPLAVLPERQRTGVGATLMEAVIEHSRIAGLDALVLLGDPAFYGRFGFVAGARFGMSCIWTDGAAFQVLELRRGVLAGMRGVVHYDSAFDAAS